MELDWLKDFLALAEHGTFSRAAEFRNVTQPAFSRRVRGLEDWTGTQLFTRGPQGAMLTPAGAAFRPFAEDILRKLLQARDETRAVGQGQASTLTIAATHALSFTFFPTWIRRFADLGSGPLNLVSDNFEACEHSLVSGEVHFLLCHWHTGMPTRLDDNRFESVRVGQDRLVALSAPSAHGAHARLPEELGDRGSSANPPRLLSYSPESGLGRILALHAPGRPIPDSAFTSHHAATLMMMAREGHGVAWLPLTLAQEDIAAGRLERVNAQSPDVEIEIKVFRSADYRSSTADALWRNLTAGH